jgi:hypothetical protein
MCSGCLSVCGKANLVGKADCKCCSAFLGSIGLVLWVSLVQGIAIVFRGIALPEKRLTAAKEKL